MLLVENLKELEGNGLDLFWNIIYYSICLKSFTKIKKRFMQSGINKVRVLQNVRHVTFI